MGEWSAARPGRTLPLGKTQYPFYRRLGEPQDRSGRAENLVPHRNSIPDRPARSSIAIPSELPGPPINIRFIRQIINKLALKSKGEMLGALCYVTRCQIYGRLMIARV